MMLPFGAGSLSLGEAMRDRLLADIRLAASEIGKQAESLGTGIASQYGAQPAPLHFETVDELLPKESDYFYKDFRAISASLAPCYALDFSTPGVLEPSTSMLAGQTVYKDHCFYSVDYWVGAISQSVWDAKDTAGRGVPGINVTLKLDSKKDPWVVRGVAMNPPAVHSFSVTVMFEFEFSHPDLVEQGRFWNLLMEEVDGELVRLIVTKIEGYWEGSLVFQGAQEENKQIPADPASAGGEDDEAELAQKAKKRMGASPEQQTERRTTVKLTTERKAALGITDQGEEFPDERVLTIVDSLAARAAAGEVMLGARRAECLRLATLAECGVLEGQLNAALSTIINSAQGDQLEGLITMYQEKAGAQFTATCTNCGTTGLTARSSVEDRTSQPQKPGKPAPHRLGSVF